MKTQTNLRLSTETKSQLHQLQSVTGLNITEIVILAIDRMFNQDCYKTTDILWKVIDPKYLLPGEKPYNTTYTYFLRKTVEAFGVAPGLHSKIIDGVFYMVDKHDQPILQGETLEVFTAQLNAKAK